MPGTSIKKKVAKKPYKKVYKKKTGWVGPLSKFVKNDPFPVKKFVRLTYTDSYTLSTYGAGSYFVGTAQTIALNGMFDVDLTGGGHQPYGFDQMMLLYHRYKVTKCQIDLEFTDPSADGCAACLLITSPSDSTSISGVNPAAISEKAMGLYKPVNNTGSQIVRIKQTMPMHDLFGVTKSQFFTDIDNTTGNISGNPGSVPKLQIGLATLTGVDSTIRCKVTVTYSAEFYSRITLAQS